LVIKLGRRRKKVKDPLAAD